jgi:hypothetical protein
MDRSPYFLRFSRSRTVFFAGSRPWQATKSANHRSPLQSARARR